MRFSRRARAAASVALLTLLATTPHLSEGIAAAETDPEAEMAYVCTFTGRINFNPALPWIAPIVIWGDSYVDEVGSYSGSGQATCHGVPTAIGTDVPTLGGSTTWTASGSWQVLSNGGCITDGVHLTLDGDLTLAGRTYGSEFKAGGGSEASNTGQGSGSVTLFRDPTGPYDDRVGGGEYETAFNPCQAPSGMEIRNGVLRITSAEQMQWDATGTEAGIAQDPVGNALDTRHSAS